jgi:hypothetical protein|tara:strand:- start:58 stop:771 length:714 start_codon:yes stop_codon:yes gene_type:complete
MKKISKVVWIDGENLFVVNKAKTANKKITDGSKIVQTYTFSLKQWELATTSKGFKMNDFFSLDGSNCLDCPFSVGSGNGGCYTHKFQQYSGMLMMLRSIKADALTPLDKEKYRNIMDMSHDTYIRFGTYGEPSLLPIALVESMSLLSKSWTGYTHQWKKEWANDYGKFFMASTHNQAESRVARGVNYRSFIATKDGSEDAVGCPASKEMGFKTNCAKCGLCSGTEGKGRKDIKILEH